MHELTKLSAGEKYFSFTIDQVIPLEEIQLLLYEITHIPSGAKIIHLANDEKENLFCISFKTYPSNNKGTPHILEHAVLCGSKNYPTRDPFFSMNRRSLATFMNALTGNDFTAYPAATTNETDFYHLLSVYLDAVFFPLLKKESFLQEGCRLELIDNMRLEAKGIVFTEMQGALSRVEHRLWRDVLRNMFPNHPYGYNSGGDPEAIIDLSYSELLDFHRQYYSPSRAVFFFCGSIPLQKHLDFINDRILSHAKPFAPIPVIPLVERWSTPKYTSSSFPAEENTKQSMIVFGWLTTHITQLDDVFALSLIDTILMDNDASLLKKDLLASGLCTQADGSLEDEMREAPYFITCRGCDAQQADALEKILFTRLQELAQTPIDPQLIFSSLYQMEIARAEITGDRYPYALELFYRTVLPYQQGGSLSSKLEMQGLFSRMEALCQDLLYLPSLIERYLVKNTCFIRHILQPDTTILDRETRDIEQILAKKFRHLQQQDKHTLEKDMQDFAHYQQSVDNDNDVESLPKLKIEDIPLEVPYYPLIKTHVDQLTIYHHSCQTNQMVYLSLSFDMPQIDDRSLQYVQLFLSCLTEVGVGGKDYRATLETVQNTFGDINASLSLNVQAENTTCFYPSFTIHCKGLEKKIPAMFAHLKDMILSADFSDHARIQELILQDVTTLEDHLSRNAPSYALSRSRAAFSSSAYLHDQMHGLPYFLFLKDLAKHIDQRMDEVLTTLQHMQRTLFHLNSPVLVITCDQQAYESIQENKWFDLNKFSTSSYSPWIHFPSNLLLHSTTFTLPIQGANNAFAIETVPYMHPHSGALNLAALLFENKILHKQIREERGAYGCSADLAAIQGIFYFSSYRDPHIFSTYQSFLSAVHAVAEGKFSHQDLEEAKLGFFQQMDSPISPGSRATWSYSLEVSGLNKSIRQKYRDNILATTREDLCQAVKESLLPRLVTGVFTSFANSSLAKRETPLFDNIQTAPMHLKRALS